MRYRVKTHGHLTGKDSLYFREALREFYLEEFQSTVLPLDVVNFCSATLQVSLEGYPRLMEVVRKHLGDVIVCVQDLAVLDEDIMPWEYTWGNSPSPSAPMESESSGDS